MRRQPEPGFARVDPLRGRVSEQLQERNQRPSIRSARGRSQALRCPSKRGSSILPPLGDPHRSLWLGHASIQSTEAYLWVDPVERLEILAARLPPSIAKGLVQGRNRPSAAVLADVSRRVIRRNGLRIGPRKSPRNRAPAVGM